VQHDAGLWIIMRQFTVRALILLFTRCMAAYL